MCKFGLWNFANIVFSPGPKVLSANIVFFRLAQKYLVQMQHFFAWLKTILQKYNGSCKNAFKSNRFWCVNSACDFSLALFRMAQKYLVQMYHSFAWPKTILQNYNGSCKNALKSNRFWCVNLDCEIWQVLHFFAWPKSAQCKYCFFSLGQKVLSANTALFRLAQNNFAKVQWKL